MTQQKNYFDNKCAFTIIELLVILSIASIILAFLIPAVQSARESSRKLQCIANMKQIGIALSTYHSFHNMFTPSHLLTGKKHSSNNMSELGYLLPYLEHVNAYNSINYSLSKYDTSDSPTLQNRTVRNTQIAVYLCPSDSEINHLNNYRFNHGCLVQSRNGARFNGPFNIGVMPSQATITDGVTYTAFVSERCSGTFNNSINYRTSIKYYGGQRRYKSDELFIPECLGTTAYKYNNTAGRFWFYTNFSDTQYNHNGVPNDARESCALLIAHDNGFGLNPPRSNHSNSVNVLFGDGHVQSISSEINQRVWYAAGTYNQGD